MVMNENEVFPLTWALGRKCLEWKVLKKCLEILNLEEMHDDRLCLKLDGTGAPVIIYSAIIMEFTYL